MYDTLTEDKKQNNTGTSEYVLRNGGQTNIVMKYLKFFYFRWNDERVLEENKKKKKGRTRQR